MGEFRIGKPALLGKGDVSTGSKVHIGKLPNCLFGVHINEPTGNIMQLHDAYRGKTFEADEEGLTGYPYRAIINYNASVGGEAGYQFLLKCYYATEALYGGDVGNVNGTEVLDGEPTPIPKIYLNRLCRWDFGDVRFQLKGVVGASAYTYRLIEKVDGVWALFMFKMNENPDTARTVCCYWGKQTAVDESSDSAAEAIIPNVAGAWPLDEADTEVDPIVIADNAIANWETWGTGIAISNETIDDINYLKMVCDSAQQYANFSKHYATPAVWSSKSRVRFRMIGTNSGVNFGVKMYAPDNDNYCQYIITDNFIGLKQFNIPFGSFAGIGVFSFNTISAFMIFTTDVTLGTWYFDRFIIDEGVLAVDYSGNSNDGVAHGTQIVPHPLYPNKTARNLKSLDHIYVPSKDMRVSSFTYLCQVRVHQHTGGELVLFRATVGNDGYEVFSEYNKRLNFNRIGTSWTNAFMLQTGINSFESGEDVNIAVVSDGLTRKIFVNGVKVAEDEDTALITPTTVQYQIGLHQPTLTDFTISNVFFLPSVLTDEQIFAIHESSGVYPDSHLNLGSVVCRKYASTTLPTVASVSPMRTRKSFGTQELYPAVDGLNPVLDRVNKKFTQEFYLENTQEESSNVLVIAGSNQAEFWTPDACITLTNIAGTNRVQMTKIAGEGDGLLTKVYSSNQDWSTKEFIIIGLHGANTGYTFKYHVQDVSGAYIQFNIIDNYIGLKFNVFAIANPTVSFGTINMAQVKQLQLFMSAGATKTGTWILDQQSLDVGVWAYVEIGVPDKLQTEGDTLSGTYDITKWTLFFWNGSAWASRAVVWDGVNWVWLSSNTYALNGSTFQTIFGEPTVYSPNTATAFIKGKRGETKTRKQPLMANKSIVYSKAKTKYRVGFAIKMPPADLNASATSGGGQVRVKCEVNYV